MKDGTIIFNPKYNKYDGYHNGKVVSRAATVSKVEECLRKNYSTFNTTTVKAAPVNPVRAQVQKKVSEVVGQVRSRWPSLVFPDPTVEFFNRGTTAGKAYYSEHRVTYNEVLAAENGDKFDNTVIHEVAHLVTRKLHPFAKAHGPEFKHVMRSIGGNGERCHSFNVASVKQKMTYYVYACGCQKFEISAIRHGYALRGKVYKCRVCRTQIAYQGQSMMK